jgi:tRNA (mo5U34)-methyltransferase
VTLQSYSAGIDEIDELGPWFHNLHLPDGTQTAPNHPLGDFPRFKWQELAPHLPADLRGWTALDIGCNAGFYSFELARRGADVVGIDADEHYLRQARWAREQFELDVEFRRLTVYELARMDERFDLVLFMGVLYHLRYPLLALDAVAERVDRLLVLQTLTLEDPEELAAPEDVPLDERALLEQPGWPRTAFVERRVAGDATNWWVPNRAAVRAMARSAGLEVVAEPLDETFLCRPRGLPAEVAAELRHAAGD